MERLIMTECMDCGAPLPDGEYCDCYAGSVPDRTPTAQPAPGVESNTAGAAQIPCGPKAIIYAPWPEPALRQDGVGYYNVYQLENFADATHALRASHGQAPAGATDPQLLKFYGVSTDAELIAAQARHIERLQAKLPQTPSLAPQRVREG